MRPGFGTVQVTSKVLQCAVHNVPHRIVYTMQNGAWDRLFWGVVLHADEWHLYYNMSSLLWKGLQLETSLGSARFAALMLELWASCSLLLCGAYCAGTLPALRPFLPALAGTHTPASHDLSWLRKKRLAQTYRTGQIRSQLCQHCTRQRLHRCNVL